MTKPLWSKQRPSAVARLDRSGNLHFLTIISNARQRCHVTKAYRATRRQQAEEREAHNGHGLPHRGGCNSETRRALKLTISLQEGKISTGIAAPKSGLKPPFPRKDFDRFAALNHVMVCNPDAATQ